MKIAVCIKQVPGTTAVEVDPVTGTLKRDGVESKLNPYDLYALETALRLKEKLGAELTAFTMGPPQAEDILREAYMMGVDAAVLISDRKFGGADVLATSYAISQAITAQGPFDLVVTGRQTTDGDTAQVGSEVAEFLGITHAASVTSIDGVTPAGLTVTCDLPLQRMTLRLPFPALIAVEKAVGEPRLPSYKRKLATAGKPITVLALKDMADGDESHYGQSGSPTRVVRIFPPEADTGHEHWEGDGTSLADRLYHFLADRKFLQRIG
ncbi:MAG: electron transfer flavoprotein subunit beta/FixA family protein [Victivallaceae bacterium]|nr:electron transfer flavoprotein subunit beta/FixA family protein [Victivallaceae bacterium]